MASEPLPLVVLCGFLGSGKTTLLRRWSRDEPFSQAPVIVHDLSEFGLDAELLAEESTRPKAGRLVGRVAALHGRHARDQLHSSVGAALDEISALDPAPAVVFCESTGAARPWPLIKALIQNKGFFLRHFIVTVDALNLHRDFADGRALIGEVSESQDAALRQAAGVLAEQIVFASLIVLTKIDTVPKSVVESQARMLQRLQPRAAVALSAQAGLRLPQLDGIPAPKLDVMKGLAQQFDLEQQASTADNVEALVFRNPRPFHPERLYEACHRHLITGVYRTKGYLWLASRPGHVLLWQQSGSQIALELNGIWRAESLLNREGLLLPEEIELLQTQLEEKHPVFGDRHNELTLIGVKEACEAFASILEKAICTDEEIDAWQNDESFADPWPQSLRRF